MAAAQEPPVGGAAGIFDYLIIGAGAAGMAFADSILAETDKTIAMVDRRDRAGGHWNDAYPFVRLHQPSANYGLNSAELGSGAIDEFGYNAGNLELASGQEVVHHFDTAMRRRFLPSGRVEFFPMSEVVEDRVISGLLDGSRRVVDANKVVDATWSKMSIPSTTPPAFQVTEAAAFAPVNDLPRIAADFEDFVVIGAGKTGIDACTWLLANGVDPGRIRWVMPRDSWLLRRGNFQLTAQHFARLAKSLADQVEAIVLSVSIDDLFARLEQSGELARIDRDVVPAAYHCAIVSDGELEALRRINDVIRLGRIASIGADRIELEQGVVSTTLQTLHVDCSAAGIPSHPSTPIFDGDRITLQWVRTCQPTFSAAFIGHVEAAYETQDRKNELCGPIVPPSVPIDWLLMMKQELANRAAWATDPQIDAWQLGARLDGFGRLIAERGAVDQDGAAHLGRYLTNFEPAQSNIDRLLATSPS